MINVYFSTTDASDKVQDDIVEQLSSLDNVSIKSYENEKNIPVTDDVFPSIICITPHTYNKDFLNKALEVMIDHPRRFVLLYIKCEYNNLGHLVGYRNDEIEFIELVKLAISCEDERMYESIFALKYAFRKLV